MSDPLHALTAIVREASAHAAGAGAHSLAVRLERPQDPAHGHYSTNAAMVLAGAASMPPRDLAERITAELGSRLGDQLEAAEIAGPGFCNLTMSPAWHRRAIAAVAHSGPATPVDEREAESSEGPILVEFVSANPTGPITVAAARHAAYGDALARLLEFTGAAVEREYYINDTGGQIERFGASVSARMKGEHPPEDGYAGDYVTELAQTLIAEGVDPGDEEGLTRRSVELMMDAVRASLARFRVEFGRFSSEAALHGSGAVADALAALEQTGHVFESEGARWLRTSELGDDKDRVLVRGEGDPTYFAADIAYHREKLARAARLIDVLGADHHGYVARMRAALTALGFEPERFEVVIMQLVHLVEGGQRAQMAKRKGEFVTLDELIDEIGVDAARYFLLQRSHDSTVEVDLELARRQSSDNPVYYVQYAHARMKSIERKAAEQGSGSPASAAAGDAPVEPSEAALIRDILDFPTEAVTAAEKRAPHRICAYATRLAAGYHAFYRDCQIVGAPDDLEPARLEVGRACADTIASALSLLGVSAPDKM